MKNTSDHLNAVQLVAMNGSGQAQRGSGQDTVGDQDRRRYRHTFKKLRCGPGEALRGTRQDFAAKQYQWLCLPFGVSNCIGQRPHGFPNRLRLNKLLGGHRCLAGTRIGIDGRILNDVDAVVRRIDRSLARQQYGGREKEQRESQVLANARVSVRLSDEGFHMVLKLRQFAAFFCEVINNLRLNLD